MPTTDRERAERVAREMSAGARRACIRMTDQWQFCGKATFNANGAHALHWAKDCGGRGAVAEAQPQKDGKWSRTAYRLTPFGLTVRQILIEENEG